MNLKAAEKWLRDFMLCLGLIIIVVMFAPMLLEYMGIGEVVRANK